MAKRMGRREFLATALGAGGVLGIGLGAVSVAQDATPAASPMASPMASPSASPVATPAAAAAAITIEGFDIGWRYEGQSTAPGAPIEVPVSPGMTINLPNTGVAAHNFVVDEWGALVDMPIGGTVTYTVPTDAAPGTYRFYCNVPGHEAAGMVGNLIVQ